MNDLISRQAVIDALYDWSEHSMTDAEAWHIKQVIGDIKSLPSAQPEPTQEIQDILDYLDTVLHPIVSPEHWDVYSKLHDMVSSLPSAQPEQRYTEEELRVFAHGISLSLLPKRSAQHWRYDKDAATEIEFLERLYDKVSADMKGGQG